MTSGDRPWIRPLIRAVVLLAIGAVVAVAVTLEATDYRRSEPASGVELPQLPAPPEAASDLELAQTCWQRLSTLDSYLPGFIEYLQGVRFPDQSAIDIAVELLVTIQFVVDWCIENS